MKKCPYCAEEIQDEAIKCRFCGSDLTQGPGVATQTTTLIAPPPSPAPGIEFTHSGQRYLLGYGPDFFGIWDRQAPGPPVQRFSRNDEGWRTAWSRFVAMEPAPVDAKAAGAATPLAGRPRGVNGMAVASLVLGILWLWWIGSVLALVFGYMGKAQIEASGRRQEGRGLAIAGIVLGWIGVGVLTLTLLLYSSYR